ncbi:MAG: MarR family winged helix-turn-helix transcriptional regulator [Candidatus Choladocola sp.]|nr:MarR family winged helix-turn-helix transcriptional regulator [Candidatus Choladocola sp.]
MMEQSEEVLLHGTQFKQLFEKRIAAVRAAYGLRRIDVEILYYLDCCGDRNTSKDIGNTHMFTKGHISQSVERLQQMKLLTATPDRRDKRCIHFQLTAEAGEIVQTIIRIREELNAVIFEGITKQERDTLREVAEKIAGNIDRAMRDSKEKDGKGRMCGRE